MDKKQREEWLASILDEGIDAIVFVPSEKWAGWLVYILETLQCKASSARRYEEFLRSLRDAITARLEDGRW